MKLTNGIRYQVIEDTRLRASRDISFCLTEHIISAVLNTQLSVMRTMRMSAFDRIHRESMGDGN